MSGPLYLTVLLEPDVDTDDAREISQAIELFQGVQEVMTGTPAVRADAALRESLKREILGKVMKALEP